MVPAMVPAAARPDRRPASIGLFLFFCAGFADGILLPFFPLWASSVAHVPKWGIGLLFACYAGGEILAAPFIGGIADRVGRRPVLILSSLGVGLGLCSLFAVRGIWEAALVLVLSGMCESVLHPTIQTAIGDVIEPSAQRRWYNLVRVSSGAGQIFGPVTGAWLALISLPAVFLGAGFMLVLGGGVAWMLLAETRRFGVGMDDEEEGLASLLPVFTDRRLAGLLLWLTLFEVSGHWIDSVIPLYAHDTGALSPSGVGTLFAFGAVLTVGLQMVVHRIGDSWSPMRLTIVAGIVAAAGFALLVMSPTIGTLAGAVALCSVAQMLTGPLLPIAVNALAPPRRRATYMAAASVATDLKDSLGPSIGTALYAVTPRLPWCVGIPLVIVSGLGLGTAFAARNNLLSRFRRFVKRRRCPARPDNPGRSPIEAG